VVLARRVHLKPARRLAAPPVPIVALAAAACLGNAETLADRLFLAGVAIVTAAPGVITPRLGRVGAGQAETRPTAEPVTPGKTAEVLPSPHRTRSTSAITDR
jgi:hypothetical protein